MIDVLGVGTTRADTVDDIEALAVVTGQPEHGQLAQPCLGNVWPATS